MPPARNLMLLLVPALDLPGDLDQFNGWDHSVLVTPKLLLPGDAQTCIVSGRLPPENSQLPFKPFWLARDDARCAAYGWIPEIRAASEIRLAPPDTTIPPPELVQEGIAELLKNDQAHVVLAEVRHRWRVTLPALLQNCEETGRVPAVIAGLPELAQADLPVEDVTPRPLLFTRGIALEKRLFGLCELAGLFERVLTGEEIKDAAV